MTAGARIRAVDWLRGLAVFDMIMWHAGILIHPSHNGEATYGALGYLAGLVAPSFMFAAGFAIALVMVRASGDPAARRRRALKSLQRIAEVLIVAFILKWFLTSGTPYWAIRIDILSCIALSLLIAWPFQFFLASRPRVAAGVCLGMALAAFLVAPLIPPGWWGPFIAPGSSDFALIPWAGYVFLGATAGALASLGTLHAAFGLAIVYVLGTMFLVPGGAWNSLYGNAFEITNHGERLRLFGAVALVLFGIEQLALKQKWKLGWPPFNILEIVGTNALTAYVTHITLLFIPLPPLMQFIDRPNWQFSFFKFWGYKLHWLGYWSSLVALWVLTVFVCWGWPLLSKWVKAKMPWNRAKAPPKA